MDWDSTWSGQGLLCVTPMKKVGPQSSRDVLHCLFYMQSADTEVCNIMKTQYIIKKGRGKRQHADFIDYGQDSSETFARLETNMSLGTPNNSKL